MLPNCVGETALLYSQFDCRYWCTFSIMDLHLKVRRVVPVKAILYPQRERSVEATKVLKGAKSYVSLRGVR